MDREKHLPSPMIYAVTTYAPQPMKPGFIQTHFGIKRYSYPIPVQWRKLVACGSSLFEEQKADQELLAVF